MPRRVRDVQGHAICRDCRFSRQGDRRRRRRRYRRLRRRPRHLQLHNDQEPARMTWSTSSLDPACAALAVPRSRAPLATARPANAQGGGLIEKDQRLCSGRARDFSTVPWRRGRGTRPFRSWPTTRSSLSGRREAIRVRALRALPTTAMLGSGFRSGERRGGCDGNHAARPTRSP